LVAALGDGVGEEVGFLGGHVVHVLCVDGEGFRGPLEFVGLHGQALDVQGDFGQVVALWLGSKSADVGVDLGDEKVTLTSIVQNGTGSLEHFLVGGRHFGVWDGGLMGLQGHKMKGRNGSGITYLI